MVSTVDRWLLRCAAVGVLLLALYVYSDVLVNHLIWKMQITQAVNGLSQAVKPPGFTPAPKPAEQTSPK